MSDTLRELPLLISGGHGEPERLILLGVPDEGGMIRVRIWTSEDWSQPPRMHDEPRDGLLEWIETMVRAGHTLNQSLTTVRHWLRGMGASTH